jgi:predicted Zn-dependent peptidase
MKNSSPLPLDCPYRLKEFPNALRCLALETTSNLCCVKCMIQVGNMDENPFTYELFHLLEHLSAVFTSKKYPSQKKVHEYFNSLGVTWNASTEDYDTSYWFVCENFLILKVLDVFLHSLTDFHLDQTIFHQEVHAVQEELRTWGDNLWYDAEYFQSKLLFPNQRASVSIKVSQQSVARATPETLLALRDYYYVPAKMLLILAAPAEILDTVLSFTECHLSHFQPKTCPIPIPLVLQSSFLHRPNVPLWDQRWPKIHQVQISSSTSQKTGFHDRLSLLFMEPLTSLNPTRYILECLLTILVNGDSRLNQKLRYELGLVYDIDYEINLDPMDSSFSTLTITTSLRPHSWSKALKVILQEIQNVLLKGVTEKEIHSYRLNTKMDSDSERDDQGPSRYIQNYAYDVLWTNHVITNQTKYTQMLSITPQLVHRFAPAFLDMNKLFVVVASAGKSPLLKKPTYQLTHSKGKE